MKDITHEILSELHKLLSIATAEQLRHAGRALSVSPHMRSALEELAREKSLATAGESSRSDASAGERALNDKVGTILKRASDREKNRENKVSAILDGARVSQILESSLKALEKAKIVAAARAVGLQLSARPKDARSKVIRRLARLILATPAEKQADILRDLRGTADRQTEGWFEVIRKGD